MLIEGNFNPSLVIIANFARFHMDLTDQRGSARDQLGAVQLAIVTGSQWHSQGDFKRVHDSIKPPLSPAVSSPNGCVIQCS